MEVDNNQAVAQEAEWDIVDRVVLNMWNPKYTIRQYHVDAVSAFPELELSRVTDDTVTSVNGIGTPVVTTLSGRSCAEEYQCTIGALFAMFWLMRAD